MSNVLIVGSNGRMGRWFYRYLRHLNKRSKNIDKGCLILPLNNFYLIDTNYENVLDNLNEKNVFVSNKVNEFIPLADMIVFCTPTKVTIDILKNCITFIKPNALILEISSLKTSIHKQFLGLSRNLEHLHVLSIHPMFGPGASFTSKKNTIIHVPISINNIEKNESKILRILFPNFKITSLNSSEEHDTLISLIISLIYFINLVFTRIMLNVSNSIGSKKKNDRLIKIKELSGSSFKVQSLLSESIMTDDNSLFVGLFSDSPDSLKIIKEYGKLYNELIAILEQKDVQKLMDLISQTRSELVDQIDINESYKILYKFINK